jgi:Flp pilus assembly pilin Flp
VTDVEPLSAEPHSDPVAAAEELLSVAEVLRRDLRRRLIATWVAVGVLVAAVAVVLFTVVHQVKREVHGQICDVVAITYTGPVTTDAGRMRQAQAREFARAIGCIPKGRP